MRTLAPITLAFSLVLSSPSLAANEVKFEADPIVTVELHEGTVSYSLIYYGLACTLAIYAIASLKNQRIHDLNLRLLSFLTNRT